MAVMVTRQERHFEPSMCRVLGANKKPKGEALIVKAQAAAL
jgi:hypothetical protein